MTIGEGVRDDASPDPVETWGPRRSSYRLPPEGIDVSVLGGREELATVVEGDVGAIEPEPRPDAVPPPPQRRSLDDDALIRAVTEDDAPATETIVMIERFEAQLELRERDAHGFREWEAEVLALGTPEALEAVERARLGFTGVVPVPAAPPIAAEAPPTQDPPSALEFVVPSAVSEPVAAVLAGTAVPRSPLGAFSLEAGGMSPTPLEQRAGRAVRLFWLWFAANSSAVGVGVGASVYALGPSLRQAILAVLAGIALSFLPLGLGTLAGKWSGQPTLVVSRATFGLLGNALPAAIALLSRVFWAGVLLWLLASGTADALTAVGANGALRHEQLGILAVAIAFLVALMIAFLGFGLIARLQAGLSVASAALLAALVAITAPRLDLRAALAAPDGSWWIVVTGAVLVFSYVGLAWANSGADLARYQRPSTSGGASMIWAGFGATLPAFGLIGWGVLLAASDPELAAGLAVSPLGAIAGIAPAWFTAPLIAAAALSLVSGAAVSLYSGAFALQAIGVRAGRQSAVVFVGGGVFTMAALLTLGVDDLGGVLRDAGTTVAVPVAAWAGLFAAEMMIRNRRFDARSLLGRGGRYADVRWVNLVALVVASAIGLGLTTATVSWLGWQGYLLDLAGVPASSPLATSDVGVLVALALGLAVPLLTGVAAIRRQESAKA